MGLLDMLSQLSNASQVQDHHYDQVAQQAGPDMLGSGLAEAFRSDQTPPMGDMVSQLFGQSNGQQQAGMLNQILASLGPAATAALAGGALSRVMAPGGQAISAEQASRLSPSEVRDVGTQAQQQSPGLADQLGRFYADHSGLIKVLGGAALLVAMTKMKDHATNRS